MKVTREQTSGTRSGTNIPHEYRKQLPQQSSEVVAFVNFLHKSVREELLRSSLSSYYRYNVDPPEDIDEDEDAVADTALETLLTLFCDHQAFGDKAAAKEWLGSTKSENDEQKLDELKMWMRQLLADLPIREDELQLSASDTSELNPKLQRYRGNDPVDNSDSVSSL